jgi:hypothetical protein
LQAACAESEGGEVRKYRIRQLIDGRFLVEEQVGFWLFKEWLAIDLKAPNYLWWPDSSYYRDCIGCYNDCIKALASRGHGMNPDLKPEFNKL